MTPRLPGPSVNGVVCVDLGGTRLRVAVFPKRHRLCELFPTGIGQHCISAAPSPIRCVPRTRATSTCAPCTNPASLATS